MNTHLIAVDGCQVVLSNSTVAAASLRRFRPGLPVGHRFSIGLDYAFPPSQALELLQQVVSLHPQVMSEPPPTVWVSNYADSSVTYEVLVFQSETGVRAELQLRSELLEQIWYALEREGQSIPFPVRELRRHRDNQPQSAAARFDTIALLSANPLLRHLRDDQRQQLAERTHYQRFARGEVIVREGDPGDALFQVVRGSVEVLKQNQDQELLKVAELRNGDVFGEMTLCADEPRNATVRAQQESWLLKLARQDLLPLIQADPSTLDGIASLVARRRSELDSHANLNAEANENLLKKMHQLFQNLLNSA